MFHNSSNYNKTMTENNKKSFPIIPDLEQDFMFEIRDWEPGDYPLHYHDHFELELITDGSGYQIFNGERTPLEKKDMYFLRPLDYHKIHSNQITIAHIKIKVSELSKWIAKRLHAIKNPIVFHLTDEQFELFKYLFSLIEKESNNKKDDFLDVRQNLIELLFTYFIRLDDSMAVYEDSIVNKVIYYLQKNNRFTQKVSLDEIAQNVGYSKYYISMVFHKEYGSTIQDFIINQRIEFAKKLILETNLPMTEIIMECGFSSTSNFYSKFNENVGCSPLKFKRVNKTKEG